MTSILIVEDDLTFSKMLKTWLERKGFNADTVSNVLNAEKILSKQKFDLVLSDLRLPDKDGLYILSWMKKKQINSPVIIMTSYAEVQNAVEAMKQGASDYIAKPVQPDLLLEKIQDALHKNQSTSIKIEKEKKHSAIIHHNEAPIFMEGKSEAARQLYNYVALVAPTPMSVLIYGASGTGKEYVAHRIHQLSKRSDKPFVAIDCGAMLKELSASEFFGHVKGSFTGAVTDKTGAFVEANGGTLFLDEIGEIPMSVQAKLLEFIQEKTFVPVGGTRSKKIDVRIIAATNQDLPDMIEKKLFREDLYYRLSVITVNIPSLSERPEDISLLLDHYMEYFNCKHSVNVNMTEAARRSLERYSYPGNIRELEHLVEFLILNSEKGKIQLSDLPTNVLDHNDLKSIINDDMSNEDLTLKEMLSLEEGRIVRRAYQNYGSSYKVAEKLGISQSTAHRLINKYCKQ